MSFSFSFLYSFLFLFCSSSFTFPFSYSLFMSSFITKSLFGPWFRLFQYWRCLALSPSFTHSSSYSILHHLPSLSRIYCSCLPLSLSPYLVPAFASFNTGGVFLFPLVSLLYFIPSSLHPPPLSLTHLPRLPPSLSPYLIPAFASFSTAIVFLPLLLPPPFPRNPHLIQLLFPYSGTGVRGAAGSGP